MRLLKKLVGLEESSGPSEDEALDTDIDDVVAHVSSVEDRLNVEEDQHVEESGSSEEVSDAKAGYRIEESRAVALRHNVRVVPNVEEVLDVEVGHRVEEPGAVKKSRTPRRLPRSGVQVNDAEAQR